MTEILLPSLPDWYETNICKTKTLAIVRRVVQGNLPLLPLDRISSLGKNWQDFEARREHLGDKEFEIFLQCQMAGFKKLTVERDFYPSFLLDDFAADRYEEHREKIAYNGYYSLRSEIFRACYPAECAALDYYFSEWLSWGGGEMDEPSWFEAKVETALDNHPFWVYYSFTLEETRAIDPRLESLWNSGKKKILSKKLSQDRNEYQRACHEALVFKAIEITPLAKKFVVLPKEEHPYPLQVAVQLYDNRAKFLSTSGPLKIELAPPNQEIDGVPR
jgi:hypothetical protein